MSGKLKSHNGDSFSKMCSLDVEEEEAHITSIVLWDKKENGYLALEDIVNSLHYTVSLKLN
ncbi:hypothetical protein [Jeotgalibacillus proteolyticus]|uniref:hypothetical protein n=1 Tax=Jeotgalibacillus proteolyticus TaxID=2082395 RepID=UPI0010746249|nr:hypothetical protein [Jeotgalibacillus proteolyticus]